MTLQNRLDAIRAGFENQADEPTLAVMHGATAALVASGQADRAVGEGDPAPKFDLLTTDGGRVTLADLPAKPKQISDSCTSLTSQISCSGLKTWRAGGSGT